MGFLSIDQQVETKRGARRNDITVETLHRMQCSICPLNKTKVGLRHPHMEPFGTDQPIIYILGEAPGQQEDLKGRPFVGPSGAALRLRMPEWATDEVVRWNNVVRTRPPGNKTPQFMEIECCRPSVVADIEATKPDAIFGFGNVPLAWALQMTSITKWNGRRVPVKIGTHTCWYYPMLHPSYILKSRKFVPANSDEYGSDTEFVFAMDLKRAFKEVAEGLPKPHVHTKEEALAGIEIINGDEDGDVERVLDLIDHCYDQSYVGFDYETNGLRPYAKGAKILTIGLDTKERSAAFALRHSQAGWSDREAQKIDDAFDAFLYDANCRKIVHHLAFEQEWTGYFYGKGALRSGLWGDTISQAFILDERMGKGKPGCHSLDFLTKQYFGLNIKSLSNVDRRNLDKAPVDTVLRYNALDARYHRLLYYAQHKRLEQEGMLATYRKHLERVPTMVLTSLKGIPVHQPTVKKFHKEYLQKRTAVEEKIKKQPAVEKYFDEYGKEFRPSANPDVKALLLLAGVPNRHQLTSRQQLARRAPT